VNFGGHDYAAGLMIDQKNIETFKKNFCKKADLLLKEQDILSKLHIDARMDFRDITFDFMESVSLLEPFGNENPAPILYCDAIQSWQPKVIGKTHLKIFLEQQDRFLEGIGFGMAYRKNELKKKRLKLRVCYTPQVNLFMKKASIQLQVRDFQLT